MWHFLLASSKGCFLKLQNIWSISLFLVCPHLQGKTCSIFPSKGNLKSPFYLSLFLRHVKIYNLPQFPQKGSKPMRRIASPDIQLLITTCVHTEKHYQGRKRMATNHFEVSGFKICLLEKCGQKRRWQAEWRIHHQAWRQRELLPCESKRQHKSYSVHVNDYHAATSFHFLPDENAPGLAGGHVIRSITNWRRPCVREHQSSLDGTIQHPPSNHHGI